MRHRCVISHDLHSHDLLTHSHDLPTPSLTRPNDACRRLVRCQSCAHQASRRAKSISSSQCSVGITYRVWMIGGSRYRWVTSHRSPLPDEALLLPFNSLTFCILVARAQAFLRFSFNSYHVQTKVIASRNPEWACEFWLPFMYPTYGETYTLQARHLPRSPPSHLPLSHARAWRWPHHVATQVLDKDHMGVVPSSPPRADVSSPHYPCCDASLPRGR